MLSLRLHYQRNESNALQRSGRKNYPYELQNTAGIVWIAMNKQRPYGFAEPTQFLFVANITINRGGSLYGPVRY